MKCIVATVLMAVVFATAEGSGYPYPYPYPYPYYAPAAVATAYAPPGSTVVQSYVPPYYAAPAPVYYPAAPAPTVYLAGQPGPRYTAVTRGAVHDAPLPGHTVSQQSLNLVPAPGTL